MIINTSNETENWILKNQTFNSTNLCKIHTFLVNMLYLSSTGIKGVCELQIELISLYKINNNKIVRNNLLGFYVLFLF